MYIHVYIYAHICANIYVHTNIHTQTLSLPFFLSFPLSLSTISNMPKYPMICIRTMRQVEKLLRGKGKRVPSSACATAPRKPFA